MSYPLQKQKLQRLKMIEHHAKRLNEQWTDRLKELRLETKPFLQPIVEGVLTRMVGLTLEAEGCQAPVGSQCEIVTPSNQKVDAEVVGFSGVKY